MADKLISELLDLPTQVRKGDFVLNLARGVTEPEVTLKSYYATPQLQESFDDSLNFIQGAVDHNSSKACYLHGSFGSGKSHFMAVLHLLLQHNEIARMMPELAPLCEKHKWVDQKKFLLVPYHMIGSKNMESAILGGYVDHIQKTHPEATIAGVFRAEDIFANANSIREGFGDEKFFQKLNQGTQEESGWGKLDQKWNASRYEKALKAAIRSEERSQLVGALVKNILPAFKGVAQGKEESFVSLDDGLAIISSHAKSLGYDGLILFLDELILWLASHSADLGFVQGEGNKLAKLVESQNIARPIPIISFVARQRDLRELIGSNVVGVDQLNFSDVLKHWEGRFHTITLEDRNLPLIAKHRVLKPKNEACRQELQESFTKAAAVRDEIKEVLLGKEGTDAIFQLVYPFSPAFIQALVAISSALQRERTALKIMLQILVDKRETLRLGEIIPLGDLWDVVANGEEAFTDVMRTQFDHAKKLYQNKLRPTILLHNNMTEEELENAPADNPKSKAFENDNRLIKSLLLSSLVHGVEVLKDMNCIKLAALNHGTVKSRIPNREVSTVADKLRAWAGQVGEIRLGADPLNPTVSLQLSGVDTESIVQSARAFDNPSSRNYKIRQFLFKSLQLEEMDGLFLNHEFVWRGTKRTCELLFSNVRELTDDGFRTSGNDWKVIIDSPIDSEGHSPVEDFDRIQNFKTKNESHKSLIWLPWFFNTNTNSDLGKLVILDKLLEKNNIEQHSGHLSLSDRQSARLLLQNQQSALNNRIQHAIDCAYSIKNDLGTLNTAFDLSDRVFHSLLQSLQVQPPVGATLAEALNNLLDQALSHQFPKHPKFETEIKGNKDLNQVLQTCLATVKTEGARFFVDDKNLRAKIRAICGPLEVGVMGETHLALTDYWKNHFNKMITQQGLTTMPSVGDFRKWTDLPEPRGLLPVVQNFLILIFAELTNRSFVKHGGTYAASLDDMPDELVLREEILPPMHEWMEAGKRASEIFGVVISPMLNASNLALFQTRIQEQIQSVKTANESLTQKLVDSFRLLGLTESGYQQSNRLKTAAEAKKLLTALELKKPTDLVHDLASYPLTTTPLHLSKSLKSAQSVLDAIGSVHWDLFKAVIQIQDNRKALAENLMAEVSQSMMNDEFALANGLAVKLKEAVNAAIKLLTPISSPTPPPISPPTPPPPPPPPPPPTPPPDPKWKRLKEGKKERVALDQFQLDLEEIKKQVAANPKCKITFDWFLEEEQSL